MLLRYVLFRSISPLLKVRRHCFSSGSNVFCKKSAVSCTLGFSLFTWLGFEKKTNTEDDLVITIKHCVLFMQRKEYDKAEQLLHVALKQAQQIQHNLGITYIYDLMANLALERNQLDKAKNLFVAVTQRIMSDGANENDLRVVHISLKLARISHLKKELSTAQIGYEWCLDKLNKLQGESEEMVEKLKAMAEDWYGRLFLDNKQLEQAVHLMNSALNRIQKLPNTEIENIITQLNDIGTIYVQLDKIDDSISYFKKAISLGKGLKIVEELGIIHVNLGMAFLKKRLIEDARKNCGQGLRLGVESKNLDVQNEARMCLTEIKNFR